MQIRELPKRQEIPLNFLEERETADYLREMVTDAERQIFVDKQQSLLAALDLLPDPSRSFPATVHSRARRLIGFYDPLEDQIFVGPAGSDQAIPDDSLVHQYTHALVDQHFDLLAFKRGASDGDAARARDALMEGDAVTVLAIHQFGGVDQSDLEALSEHLSEAEPTDYEGYVTSRELQTLASFPYREGAQFVSELLKSGWWPAVNAAYLDPPVSTELILHPEKYIESPRDLPRSVVLPNLDLELEGWRQVGQDVLGELLLRAHLEKYLWDTTEAQNAAAGWDGDLAAVWEDSEGHDVFVVRILWDSDEEAAEFRQAYTQVIDRRLSGASIVVRPVVQRGGRWWRGTGGDAFLQQTEDSVLLVWAPDTDIMERVLLALAPEGG
jgi:hypothetical protein